MIELEILEILSDKKRGKMKGYTELEVTKALDMAQDIVRKSIMEHFSEISNQIMLLEGIDAYKHAVQELLETGGWYDNGSAEKSDK